MSKKLNAQIEKPETIILSDTQFAFIKGVTEVQRQAQYNYEVVKTEYLREIALDHGYGLEDNFNLALDLAGEEHKLIVTPIEDESGQEAPKSIKE